MKVSAQFAFSHFEDISSAVDRGESVEILRPGNSPLQLVRRAVPTPMLMNGRRILGAGRGELRVPSEEEWRKMDDELADIMTNGPVFPAE